MTIQGSAQDNIKVQIDSLSSDSIVFNVQTASDYVNQLLNGEQIWKSDRDMLRISLERLIEDIKKPYDSVKTWLNRYEFLEIKPEYRNIVFRDTLPVKWLNDSSFIIDTAELEYEPLIRQKTIKRKSMDFSKFAFKDTIPELKVMIDSLFQKFDTVSTILIDTALLRSENIQIHHFSRGVIDPPLFQEAGNKYYDLKAGSDNVITEESFRLLTGGDSSPFYILPNEGIPDSLRAAVHTLLAFVEIRDSIPLILSDLHGYHTPFWLTTGNKDLYRYWVKNYRNDSITIWVGNPSKNELQLILEEDVDVNRMTRYRIDDIPITTVRPNRTLAKTEPLKEIPDFWDYDFSSSFALSQTYLSNWAKGGESSLTSMLDIFGQAKYTNAAAKSEWTSNSRLKYGFIITGEYGLRTNNDLFEINSQYNRIIKEKIDFSAVFYMKNQIARGYKYPNDSVVVSKFLNPASITVGLGLEYKPFKKTSLNLSPISYKNTFVLDTVHIDQTAHGIAADKRSRQELGTQLVIKNEVSILDGLNISNSMRLFSSYLNKPQNVDVDWEINLDRKINWYFTVRLNLHMIYDHDIKFTVYDENGQPVELPDGSIKKSPHMQFKEFLGLALLFKF